MELNRDVAAKVLQVVDVGLCNGVGSPEPGKMCVEAAVCYALGLPHGDDPGCVSPVLRSLKISLNDSQWSSNKARAKGLRRLAVAQLGSKDILNEKEFLERVVEMTIRKMVPLALRAAAPLQSATHKKALEAAANRCEAEGTKDAAYAAADAAAYADARAVAAYAAAYADARAAAAANAAYAAARAAARAAYAAARAAADAADAADAARAAAYAAANAAYAAAYAAYAAYAAARRDEVLASFAEEVVQILIAMKVPGTEWLDLTEAA